VSNPRNADISHIRSFILIR